MSPSHCKRGAGEDSFWQISQTKIKCEPGNIILENCLLIKKVFLLKGDRKGRREARRGLSFPCSAARWSLPEDRAPRTCTSPRIVFYLIYNICWGINKNQIGPYHQARLSSSCQNNFHSLQINDIFKITFGFRVFLENSFSFHCLQKCSYGSRNFACTFSNQIIWTLPDLFRSWLICYHCECRQCCLYSAHSWDLPHEVFLSINPLTSALI